MKTFSDKAAGQLQGWERAASLGGGLALLSKGLRHGGLLGLASAAVGGLLLARGARGRCELKARLQQQAAAVPSAPPAPARYAHMPLDSEVRSMDFEQTQTLPDSAPMGHESHVTPPRPDSA